MHCWFSDLQRKGLIIFVSQIFTSFTIISKSYLSTQPTYTTRAEYIFSSISLQSALVTIISQFSVVNHCGGVKNPLKNLFSIIFSHWQRFNYWKSISECFGTLENFHLVERRKTTKKLHQKTYHVRRDLHQRLRLVEWKIVLAFQQKGTKASDMHQWVWKTGWGFVVRWLLLLDTVHVLYGVEDKKKLFVPWDMRPISFELFCLILVKNQPFAAL